MQMANTATISLSTTHFTDFTIVQGYRLQPISRAIKVKDSLSIQVAFCYTPAVNPGGDLQSSGLACDTAATQTDVAAPFVISEWSVNGTLGGNGIVGTVSGSGPGATFTAPSTKPTPNTAAVSARVYLGAKGKTLVVSNITITDGADCTGTIRFTTNYSGVTVTNGVVNVSRKLIEDTGDTRKYIPTGTISGDVTYQGCDKVSTSSDLSCAGNNMLVYTASNALAPNTHAFALASGNDLVTTNCGGMSYQLPKMLTADVGACMGTFDPPPFSDIKHLTGTYNCSATGTNASWDFVAPKFPD